VPNTAGLSQKRGRAKTHKGDRQLRSRRLFYSFLPALVLTLLISGLAGAAPARAATPIETMPLWHLQARITTGTVAGAGTVGTPALRFNTSTTGVRCLNPAAAGSFSAGKVTTYDLRLFRDPSEITMLRLGVTGTDAWCVQKVELLLNNRLAFSAMPGGSCVSIAGGTYLEYSQAAIRSNPAWQSYGSIPSLPSSLSALELRNLVSSVSGSAIAADPTYRWDLGRAPLLITRTTSSTFTVSVGIDDVDPSSIDRPNPFVMSYAVRLFTGTDGLLHAQQMSASCTCNNSLSQPVVAQLDTALSRMTARPSPHYPLRFGMDAYTNISWSYVPVAIG
jgi:hypothetical protein